MTQTLRVQRLRGSSILKLVFIGNVMAYLVLCVLLSVPAAFGVEILSWNGEHVTGPMALIAGPLIGIFVGTVFGIFSGLITYLGLRVYGKFKPLNLEYIPLEAE